LDEHVAAADHVGPRGERADLELVITFIRVRHPTAEHEGQRADAEQRLQSGSCSG
jgi:hypothetical protein